MKTVKVTAGNMVSLVDVDFDDYRSIQQAIGGHFETVQTRYLTDYFKDPVIIMLVDEMGMLKGLPRNACATCMYVGKLMYMLGTGPYIAGDMILAQAVGEDIVAPEEPEELMKKMLRDFLILKEGKRCTK